MNRVLQLFIITITFVSPIFSDGYKLEIAKRINTNATDSYYPDLILPMNWNKSFTSSVEYRSGEMSDQRATDIVTINETIEHSRFKLNALNYIIKKDKDSYAFGFGGSYEKFEKTQKGNYFLNNSTNGNYNNNIDIEILSVYLKAETIQRLKWLDLKLYAILIPLSNLKVSQQTVFTGSLENESKNNSSEKQNFSYELDLNIVSNFNTFIDIGINANYRSLPLKYSLKILNNNTKVDKEEKIAKIKGTVYFSFDFLNGWMPSISYSKETTDSKDFELVEEKIYFGLNTKF